MSGETSLEKMLADLSPRLMDGEYVFCSFADAAYGDHADLEPLASMRESEGLTLVVPRASADRHGIAYQSVFRGIALGIHSSLDAVGLTAAFASKLAEHGISANVLAGFYHDHIFVQSELAGQAMEALDELSR